MNAPSITLIGLLLLGKLFCFESCMQLTKFCPSTKELWEKRTEEFHCRARDTSYACLLNIKNQLVETCIYEVKVEKGVVGCPYVTLCLNGLPQVGTEDKYTDCPKNIPGCPDKDHETYTLYELYKYPACFSANKSEILYTTGTTPTPHTTSRIFENEHKTTEGNSFALPIIISGIIVVIAIAAIAAFILIKRERKHSKNHMPLDSHFEEKSPLCARVTITSVRVEFVVDGVLEVIWEVLSGITDIEYYFILRQKVNKNNWELLDRATSTRSFIFTTDSPTWECYFYGVAAKRFGRKESVTWTTFPVSENMLKGKATAVGSLYKNNMPERSNENNVLLETKRLTKSSMSIHAKHQELSEQQPQDPRQRYWTVPWPKASGVLT